MPDNISAPVPAPAYTWSENTRGIVSVLLIAHLFGLGLIFWANNDYRHGSNSVVLTRAKQAFDPYLFALWFDRYWDQKIANGDEADADHALRFVVRGPDGKAFEAARFPQESGNLPEERERWQQFAYSIAHAEELGDSALDYDQLLLALGKNWLAQQRAAGTPYDKVTIEVRRRHRVSLDGDLQADPRSPQYDPPPPYGDAPRKILNPVEVSWPGGEGEPFLRKLGGEKRDQAPVVPSQTSPMTPTQTAPTPMPQAIPVQAAPSPAPQPVSPPMLDLPAAK